MSSQRLPDRTLLPAAHAFRQLVNLRVVAALFYVAFVLALSRSIAWFPESQDAFSWAANLALFTRQCFISGCSILLLAALAELALARRPLSPRATLLARGLAIGVGATLGAVLRYLVFYYPAYPKPVEWSWFAYTVGLWLLLGCFGHALLRLAAADRLARARLAEAAREREWLAAQQLQAEMSALQAQIEPHFLFNTLANVKRLYEVAPHRGRDMLVSLVAYLRAALPSMRTHESRLGDELERVRHYLEILRMRMGDRLRFEIDARPGLRDALVPPLVLPTLVENAIQHGLSPLPEGGSVWIKARVAADGRLDIEVRDDGRGFVGSGGSGVGLANTRARLAGLYGAAASLSLEAGEPRGVVARVCLPLRPAAPAAPAGDERTPAEAAA
ncbi:MAG: histidine kinase [Burkholderiaceae bacterium]